MIRFKRKYVYRVRLGYKQGTNPRVNGHNFTVIISTKSVEKATEKAIEVMKHWPGVANVTAVEMWSVGLEDSLGEIY